MRAVVVYESIYGNTHLVADQIAQGLRNALGERSDVAVVPTEQATAELATNADLLVVGGPTHVHGMTWASTRRTAIDAATENGRDDPLDPDAEGPGLRDWFDTLAKSRPTARAAAFDTRFDASPIVTGRASKGIARRLRHHGYELVDDPTSFLVDKENHLLDGEAAKARVWGEHVGRAALAHAPT